MTADNTKAVGQNRQPLASASRLECNIARSGEVRLPCAAVTHNIASFSEPFAAHMREIVYAPRTAVVSSVDLFLCPAGTSVFGGGEFLTGYDGVYIDEQYPPFPPTPLPSAVEATARWPTEDVDGEKLLVARYGIGTWGHWLGELLPKIVLAERVFPGRFSFVVPDAVVGSVASNGIWQRIRESLAVYKIAESRLFPLNQDRTYRFSTLFAVSKIWSDEIMHPHASEALRHGAAEISAGASKKLAVLRDARAGRRLHNEHIIYARLRAAGFTPSETGALPFPAQISAFKAAEAVFGVLGSDLTNLIYAPVGVAVVTAAPDVFGDRFFYALVLDRSGRMADLRGPVVAPHVTAHRGDFMLAPDALDDALRQMGL
jgi:capsular polysaccharide biosynthesis protein